MNIDESLTTLFVQYYQKMKREKKSYIPDTQVAKRILLRMYERFVSEGLTPIENLNRQDKVSLTSECRMTGERYSNQSLIEQCKILYLIKKLC